MTLTERQMHDLAGRLTRLAALAREANDASTAEHTARQRRNDADKKFAVEWVETVRQYGEANAPAWMESLRGPKPVIAHD
ncbi:hypothetical protein [Methyloversatilis discipulorum]|uniref:hypothetical protein n=1 Tax=Methyloversatilis discipulorum TaxID=1119528 RepID=UPI001A4F386E|nr:hypothetical protein [Methyloversatilis discipulorum]MBL8469676.1 hypothetical protein [Methyloversatilis discipulorum]